MTDQEIRKEVCISLQRGLLGCITPNIRLITANWDDLNSFKMRVYYDSIPSDDDIEEMEAVTSQVAADIPFKKIEPVEAVYDLRPRKDLEKFQCTVYSRKE